MDRIWLKSYPEDVDFQTPADICLAHELFEQAAADFPDKIYLNYLGRKYTYAKTRSIVDRLAAGLQERGVKRGVHVGLFMANGPAYVFFCWAILKAGGTVVNFNILNADEEVLEQAIDSGITIMVTLNLKLTCEKIFSILGETKIKQLIIVPLQEVLPLFKGLFFPIVKWKFKAKIPKDRRVIWFRDVLGDASKFIPPSTKVEDLAFLQYTGGTTGRSKGAMLTHANVTSNADLALRLAPHLRLRGEDKYLVILPFFHIFGLVDGLLAMTRLAAELVFHFGLFDVNQAIHLIEQHKVSILVGVPTMYYALADHKRAAKALKSVHTCLSGGDTLPLSTKRTFEKAAPCPLIEGYGLTEASPVVCLTPSTGAYKENSVGLPIPGCDVRILAMGNGKRWAELGEIGEICIRGPNVMAGYYKREDETKQVMYRGYLRSGDIGYMDSDGYVYIVDRSKDLVIVSGYNVYPRHVQDAIAEHPAVSQVAVVGVPDAYQQEHVKAYVVLKEGFELDLAGLRAFLEHKLSHIEMPKELEIREDLPLTTVGKVSKLKLREEERRKSSGDRPKKAKSRP